MDRMEAERWGTISGKLTLDWVERLVERGSDQKTRAVLIKEKGL